jgi:hypothetical protein
MNHIRNEQVLLAATRSALRLGIVAALAVSLATAAVAGSATWKSSPATGDWNTAANWSPATVPNGPSDIATFASSNVTTVTLSTNIEVGGITFNPGASAFTISGMNPGNLLYNEGQIGSNRPEIFRIDNRIVGG